MASGLVGGAAAPAAPAAAVVPSRRLLVLYGSQTGCAAEVAERIARQGRARHFRVRVLPMDGYDRRELVNERLVVFVASTTGQGEPPDNMKGFWTFLRRKGLPADALAGDGTPGSGLRFTVFGLGDSSYPVYNAVARRLYERLLQLGATSLHPRGLGDDQHQLGYESELDPWLAALWTKVMAEYPLPHGVSVISPDYLPPPYYSVSLVDADDSEPSAKKAKLNAAAAPAASASASADAELNVSPFRPEAAGGVVLPQYTVGTSTYTPFRAVVQRNTRLTAADHTQDVRHVELDLRGSGLRYEPGDVLLLHVHNPLTATAHFIRTALRMDPLQRVTIRRAAAGANDAKAATAVGTADGEEPYQWRLGNGGDDWLLTGPGTHPDAAAAAGTGARCRTVTLLELFAVHLDVFGTPRNSSHLFASLALFAAAAADAAAAGGAAAAAAAAAADAGSNPQLSAAMQRDKLRELASAECADDRYRYCTRERRTYAEVLGDFPLARPPAPVVVAAGVGAAAAAAAVAPALSQPQPTSSSLLLLCYLLELIPRLAPRQYSIASSPLAHGDGKCSEVHVCAALVEYRTPFKRLKRGIASEFLRDLCPPPAPAAAGVAAATGAAAIAQAPAAAGAAAAPAGSAAAAAGSAPAAPAPAPAPGAAHFVPVWVKGGSVRLPLPAAAPNGGAAAVAGAGAGSAAASPQSPPLVMVGPGTGVAPFRSMVWQRHALRARARASGNGHGIGAEDVGPIHLFFGNRYRAKDFLYGDEFAALNGATVGAAGGSASAAAVVPPTLTTLALAFSRDGAAGAKHYVQDELEKHGAVVWRVLQPDGAAAAGSTGGGGAAAAGGSGGSGGSGSGGIFLLAGNSKQMPRDVQDAVERIAVRHGGLTAAAAKQWLKALVDARRYVVETWA